MNEQARRAYALSLIWNLDTGYHAECVSKGVTPRDIEPDINGWLRIGRYASGKASAWVQANKLRKKWNNLQTEVRGVEGQEWKAEIWVKQHDGGGTPE